MGGLVHLHYPTRSHLPHIPYHSPARCSGVPAKSDAERIQQDKDGVVWRDKLIASARKEFEDARHERDPEIIARLLIGLCKPSFCLCAT